VDVRGNQIASIAPLTTLPSLERVNVSYNQLTRIAPLGASPKLTELRAEGNPLTDAATFSRPLKVSYLTADNVCADARRELHDAHVISDAVFADMTQRNLAPVYAGTRAPTTPITRWAACTDAAAALDP
jgi:hypothetical protein